MKIHRFELPPLGTNAYLLELNGEAVLIDAPMGAAEAIQPVLNGSVSLTHVLLTHGHFDHILGLAEVNEFGPTVVAHADDRHMIENVGMQMQRFGFEMNVRPGTVHQWIEPPESITVLGMTVGTAHVPGHSPGSILFHFAQQGIAFVGDAVFNGSIGRTDLPGGCFATLQASIRQKIYTLAATTRLLPGHGPETTVAHERDFNPFVRPV